MIHVQICAGRISSGTTNPLVLPESRTGFQVNTGKQKQKHRHFDNALPDSIGCHAFSAVCMTQKYSLKGCCKSGETPDL
jgi:hypothetical protein